MVLHAVRWPHRQGWFCIDPPGCLVDQCRLREGETERASQSLSACDDSGISGPGPGGGRRTRLYVRQADRLQRRALLSRFRIWPPSGPRSLLEGGLRAIENFLVPAVRLLEARAPSLRR